MSLDKQTLAELRRDGSERRERYETRGAQRRRRWIIGVGVVLVAGLGWFLLGRGGPLEVDTAIAAAPASPGTSAVLNASGYVVARRMATVSAKVTGRVTDVAFEEGSTVTEGQVLARLDDATPRAAYQVARSQRDAARLELREVEVRLAEAVRERDRLLTLRESNLVSASAADAAQAEASALSARLDATRAAVAVAESSLRLREQDLDDLVVRAPFAGVIISKDAQPGEMVSPISAGGGYTRTGIATVVDMGSREIEVDVNEAYINRVREGQRAEAVLDAYPDWDVPARVVAIVPAADRQKATVKVRIAIEQLDPRILPDMGVKVRFFDDGSGEEATAVASVPSGALREVDGAAYLWRIEDGRARRANVSPGAVAEGVQQIVEGVAVGDVVVVDPPDTLQDGDRVRSRSTG